MPTNLTEADVYTTHVSVPNPGEKVTAASVRTGFQSLANRTHNIREGVCTFSGDKTFTGDTIFNGDVTCNNPATFNDSAEFAQDVVFDAGGLVDLSAALEVSAATGSLKFKGTKLPTCDSRIYTYTQPVIGAGLNTGDSWAIYSANATYGVVLISLDTSGAFTTAIPIKLPLFSEIKDVNIYLDGSAHVPGSGQHGGFKPATMPRFTLYRRVLGTGGIVSIGSASDTSATVGIYDAYHNVTFTAAAGNFIDDVNEYYLKIEAETGAHAVNNATGIIAVTVSAACTTIAPGS